MTIETSRSTGATITSPSAPGNPVKRSRRRRGSSAEERVRYFLPKAGSLSERPELGQEAASEGEALVEALKSGQVFYSVVAWRAVPQMNGTEARIVKQPFPGG